MSTRPYSSKEGKADPGMYNYESEPKPKPKVRVIPTSNKNDIVLMSEVSSEEHRHEVPNIIHTDYKEGMSSLNPVWYEEQMDTTTSFYVGALSVVGLFVLFRVLYSR